MDTPDILRIVYSQFFYPIQRKTLEIFKEISSLHVENQEIKISVAGGEMDVGELCASCSMCNREDNLSSDPEYFAAHLIFGWCVKCTKTYIDKYSWDKWYICNREVCNQKFKKLQKECLHGSTTPTSIELYEPPRIQSPDPKLLKEKKKFSKLWKRLSWFGDIVVEYERLCTERARLLNIRKTLFGFYMDKKCRLCTERGFYFVIPKCKACNHTNRADSLCESPFCMERIMNQAGYFSCYECGPSYEPRDMNFTFFPMYPKEEFREI